jgi:nitroreductase
MKDNQTIAIMMNRKSTRKYKPAMPEPEVLETIVRAGQQAPFASQLYSVILCTKGKFAFKAPCSFVICVDAHKLELFMKKRGWDIKTNRLTLLLLGMQDASYMAENMVIAAESLGLGSCFLGEGSINADRVRYLAKKLNLPKLVLPMVELVMGYPDEEAPARPRYPMEFTMFKDAYPELDDETLERSMEVMDKGYLAQDYYAKQKCKIAIEGTKKDEYSYADYSWTEHISRKWGQWAESPNDLLDMLRERGFSIEKDEANGK